MAPEAPIVVGVLHPPEWHLSDHGFAADPPRLRIQETTRCDGQMKEYSNAA